MRRRSSNHVTSAGISSKWAFKTPARLVWAVTPCDCGPCWGAVHWFGDLARAEEFADALRSRGIPALIHVTPIHG